MSDNVRVYEIAEEAGASSTEVIAKAKDLGIELKSPQTAVSFEDAEEIANYIMTGKSSKLATKPAAKKVVKKKEPVKKETESKEEPKKEEEPKKVETSEQKVEKEEEPKKEEPKEESVKSVAPKRVVPKRRGLKIIKKKKPREEPKEQIQTSSSAIEGQPKKAMKSLSEILGGNDKAEDKKETQAQKVARKKEKKKQPPKAHDHGKVIELERGSQSDFSNASDESLLGEEVVLLDMDLSEPSKFLEENKPNNNNDKKQSRSSRPAAFGNRPQGLKRKKRKKRIKRTEEEIEITEVTIPEDVRVYEFAEACGKSASEVITVLFGLGMMVTKNDFLKQDELEILGEEFGIEVTVKDALEDANYVEDYQEEEIDETNFETRPPVVTIMGHVDHGKTSLLDKIRSSKIASGEAGGITQHISAYTIKQNDQKITFVDTPGHAAFSAMRARGAEVTDIVIIVVAADDGVKQQTEEVISHAKASGCPIIVAVNKIDKEAANMDMVKAQMAEREMTPVDWGGDIEFIGVSAKTGEGIDDLLENILLQSEILELKADPTAKAKATVVESSLEKGRGPVATVIVQNGELKVGDNIVCDTTFGRVKAITNCLGKQVKSLGLSETGSVLGLNEVPAAGSILVAQESDKEAREIATTRAEHARAKELSKSTKVSLEEMSGLIAEGKIKQLPVIIKTDVGGSLEAIKGSLEKIQNEEVKVKVVHAGVGGITESDLILAGASEGCVILGFNVRPTGSVKNKAKADGITINTYSIIYDLIDDVKDTLSGMMSAVIREENTGQAEVRDTFVVPKIGTVAGCFVTDGKVIRGGHARIIRDGVVTYTGKISSLKRFKDDVKEVSNGFECGIMFDKFNDIKVGDFIETFIQIEEKREIEL
ncbi:translation initiation factor IF-2 [Arcobacter sp. CECT 8989]|uniref:translation initiation factor IF-2 n=1 Tax=Arcobacter sp. CECT 8989 TaxID=2044509 RepID=UPI00100AADEF|nr:translation initiation factor IF-2 [Arcobacter sp. CECT 8989]RXK00581.1 translation initiation factor IF-2 [Arcobacter sp. CECT 8989]